MPHKYLIKEFEHFAQSVTDVQSLMQHVSRRIHEHIPRYNWVGFYLLNPTDPDTLILGPHTGSFTPSPTISLNQGLCGAAFSNWLLTVADNVAEDPRYVCVSDMVKSHISIPILTGSKRTGVFSIESYFLATFKPTIEHDFVETCARIVRTCSERIQSLQSSGRMTGTIEPIPPITNLNQDQRRRTLTGVRFLSRMML